ncbi:hypothetical protein K435DRAFT_850115 [Dendrothele bispora CBS 962.96]|uniref:Uncharacterized protein n=1 Tax=Dendrothele bispora (strain CBS 962.96) TaxID=1314807 RepID=A0A4S8MRJ1_DENBC|nr:hypothetical protein K435DRAFT_850115 [Dendrothele bispora CBS 962.96]
MIAVWWDIRDGSEWHCKRSGGSWWYDDMYALVSKPLPVDDDRRVLWKTTPTPVVAVAAAAAPVVVVAVAPALHPSRRQKTMSVKQGNLAVPPSLPSFASTFSSKSLSNFSSDDNSLPPIQSRSSIDDLRRVKSPSAHHLSRPSSHEDSLPRTAGRKRPRAESSSVRDDDERSSSSSSSPRVKEEPEQDMLDPSPPPSSSKPSESRIIDNTAAPPPSTILPSPLKKRRVTISGAPALDTDVRLPPEQTNSTPISPVVLGFTIQRDNTMAVEQVRSMISVKQKQQALIEQRRGSITTPTPTPAAPEERSGSTKSSVPNSRPLRRSPNGGGSSSRRPTVVSSLQVPTSPKPPLISGQQPSQPPSSSVPAHSLAPPPISIARRRANQLGAAGKKKPADILISPRENQTQEQFAPSIQSAPPIPRAGQGSNFSRFPMSIPRLPSAMAGGDVVRRTTSGNVPPTPTRFSAQRNTASTQLPHPIPGISGRSPPNASVPISSTLVPPTPSSLHHPGYSGEKSAFLAPFEMFYDALNDSKQLKNWLSEQVQRSNSLMQSLTQQQEKMNEVVESMVEKRVSGMRAEMAGLHRRVEELEDALKIVTSSSRRGSIESGLNVKNKGKQPLRNGLLVSTPGPGPMESYTFPPIPNVERDRRRVESERVGRTSSPGWSYDRDRDRDRDIYLDSEGGSGSPAPFDSRRLSVSADRSTTTQQQPRTPFLAPSPPMPLRDLSREREPAHGKLSRPTGASMSRQHSSPKITHLSDRDRDRERERDRDRDMDMSPPRRLRRNSFTGHISDDKER